jgi:adenosylmethionine-8-amino-7-oxononanoate aminotransferase
VEDKNTRAAFPRAVGFAETFAAAALDLGLMVWANSGQLDDGTGDLAMLAPPFIIGDEQIEEMVTLLSRALQHTVDQVESRR